MQSFKIMCSCVFSSKFNVFCKLPDKKTFISCGGTYDIDCTRMFTDYYMSVSSEKAVKKHAGFWPAQTNRRLWDFVGLCKVRRQKINMPGTTGSAFKIKCNETDVAFFSMHFTPT